MRNTIIMLTLLGIFMCDISFAEDVHKEYITEKEAIEIAKNALIQRKEQNGDLTIRAFRFNLNSKEEEDIIKNYDIETNFHPSGNYKNWPQPIVYKSKDFQDDTGIVAAAERVVKKTKEEDENSNGYWEVAFVPKQDHIGGSAVIVDAKTGQSTSPKTLK